MNAPNELSFLPDDYLAKKANRRTNVICGILFGLVMAGVGGTFSLMEREVRKAEVENIAVNQKFSEAARPIAQFQQLQEKERTMSHQAELAASLLEKVPRSVILADITNALPTGVSLTGFALESKKRSAPTAPAAPAPGGLSSRPLAGPGSNTQQPQQQVGSGALAYDTAMKVEGLAQTDVQVASFIAKLNASRYLREVNLIISETFQKNPNDPVLRQFKIEMILNPDADASVPSNTNTAAVEVKQ
jgi:Tfp pilus assembly protein PilN